MNFDEINGAQYEFSIFQNASQAKIFGEFWQKIEKMEMSEKLIYLSLSFLYVSL